MESSQTDTPTAEPRTPAFTRDVDELAGALSPPGYIAVPAVAVAGPDPAEFPLYAKSGEGIVEYKPAGGVISPDERKQLKTDGADYLYVKAADYPRYRLRAEAGVSHLLADKDAGDKRFAAAYQIGLQLAEDLLESPQPEHLPRIASYVAALADAGTADGELLAAIQACGSGQFSSPRHSLNVCLLALELARELKFSDVDAKLLGLGAFVHDVGRSGVADVVSVREGRLSRKDWDLVAAHPRKGADWLRGNGADQRVVDMAAQHHEQLDGQGYPGSLMKGGIHLWARIVAVADTFDWLTGARPFRQAVSGMRAVWLIQAEADKQFDGNVCQALYKVMFCPKPAPGPEGKSSPEKPVAAAPAPPPARPPKLSVPLDSFLPLPPPNVALVLDGPLDGNTRGRDRRVHHRYRLALTCRVQVLKPADEEQKISVWAQAVEISRGGMSFLYSAPLGVGQGVSLFLPTQGAAPGRNLRAVVLHSRRRPNGSFHIGVRFDLRD